MCPDTRPNKIPLKIVLIPVVWKKTDLVSGRRYVHVKLESTISKKWVKEHSGWLTWELLRVPDCAQAPGIGAGGLPSIHAKDHSLTYFDRQERRVARLLSVRDTKTGENVPNYHKNIPNIRNNRPNVHTKYQHLYNIYISTHMYTNLHINIPKFNKYTKWP
jgi:hypothetical protein